MLEDSAKKLEISDLEEIYFFGESLVNLEQDLESLPTEIRNDDRWQFFLYYLIKFWIYDKDSHVGSYNNRNQ